MLEYNMIDVSEGTGVNKTNESVKDIINLYNCLLKNANFQSKQAINK